ncbi:glycosyl hydrolase family 18 protein [Sphingoaurantiacus capsulatus]|uniref:chitinase n=1 Tax=Sphingoaurantiacus capsulatus TaxID=1771310 RepID=A0ABV7XBI7_9SPHN
MLFALSPLARATPLALALLLAACGGEDGGSTPTGAGGGPVVDPLPVQISIAPTEVSLATGESRTFACTVTNSPQTGCLWSVDSGGGSITDGGVYTAPATAGTYRVTVRAVANQSATASAVVRVAGGTVPPPAPGGSTPWVTGYYAGWFWDQMYPPQEVDMSAMTHFVFGRVAPGGGSLQGRPGQVVEGAGTAHQSGLSPDGSRSVEDYLVKRAHDAGIKALLMLGGDGADGDGFLRSTADDVRPGFVRAIVDYLVLHNYDGVDIDWENRLEGWPEQNISAAEARRRLKALITEVRAEANARPRYRGSNAPVLVTFPGYAVSINFLEPGGKVEAWQAEVANMVDQYNLMSYGIGTAFNGAGWSSWFTGPIFGATGATPIDLDSSIKAYVATGVPRSKIGIGIGFYGIYYGPSITGPRQSTERNNIFEVDDVALRYAELDRMGYLSNGTYRFDDTAKSSYRVYGAGGYIPTADPRRNPAGFLSYEDDASIAAKGEWVRSTGVGGTILWTVNYGYLPASKTNPLLASVKRHFLAR